MRKIFTLVFLSFGVLLTGQTIADFENYDFAEESFLNGSDLSGGFQSANVFLPNSYNETYGSWSGWAISNMTDETTAGFTNQYSAYAGIGAEGSENFAVAAAFSPVTLKLNETPEGSFIQGLYITNNTYAALSMRDGDAFAKAFGGETGDDPDFFILTIKKWIGGSIAADSINFYLADYTSSDNTKDYILKDWEYVDLTDLGPIDSLQFSLSSSDVGMFGMNTPAYFCLDQVSSTEIISDVEDLELEPIELTPNPVQDLLYLQSASNGALYEILNIVGQVVDKGVYNGSAIDVRSLPSGEYFVRVNDAKRKATLKLVKL